MRKTSSFLFISILGCMNLFAQNVPDWENPEVFAVNKENTRTTSLPYPSEELAVGDNYDSSPYYQSLNGKWKFHWVPRVSEVPAGFYEENYDISGWGEMPVPGNWEFNGYGIPMYVNTGFGFRAKPPHIDREDSPTGAYRHEFSIPDSWDGRRIFIHFEGGTNSMYVWVNGQKVGYTQNSKSPAEFDITDYVRKGKNTLACQVHKFSDGSYLEDQDMWRLGGINRNVYLYSTAQTRIFDFFAHPDLDKNYKSGIFSVDITLKNYTDNLQNNSVEISLLDKSGKKIFSRNQKSGIPANGTADITVSGNVSNPLKWTAETPNLYTMLITLKDGNGRIVESTSHKIGFRKIEITDGQLFVNGKKVFFKGVNLHEFNTHTGQVVTRKEMMRNLQLMKELNINAVRTSHYPQQPLWYKLCDEYGIYLVDEANLESHGLGYGPDNVSNFPEWHGQHMDRIIRLVERDKNHASVIFWSLGNEASNGKAFFDMYDWVKARDNSRPVQYEQAYQRDRNTDVICHMYPSWENMKRDAAKDLGKPYIMCEYAHAMGNSMGNFQEYWDLMRSSKNMQGGFIWEWYNHGYPTHDEQGRFYWAYGGDLKAYNKMNNDNFCMDGIISPDQNYIPHTYIVKKVYQDILFEAKDLNKGIITVINDFKFTDLASEKYSFKWVLLKNGEEFKEGAFTTSVPADSRKDVHLNLPALAEEAGVEYFLQVYAYSNQATELIPSGFEVAKEEFALNPNNYFVAGNVNGQIAVEKQDDKIIVKAGNLSYEFSSKDGRGLLSMKNKGQDVFRELPRLNFWRALTDNEFGEWMQYSTRIWESAGHNTIYKYKGSGETAEGFKAEYEVKLRGIEAKVEITYTVNKDGSLTTSAHYKALSDDLPEMLRFGMLMTLPKDYNGFTWYGRGPHENYVDRKHDTFMGIWNGKVEEQAFAYYRPQETGNKTDVRWLTLKNENGKGIRVDGAQPLSVSATNNRPEDLDPGMTKKQQHWSDVLPRHEVVLCVDLFQRGVGGLQSWGAKPLDQYRFMDKEYSYSYTISVNDL
ncbi:MAG: glycoside hydrolase family 2 TIM barrel-domain containing protein [Proteiniphilum sp.]|uniref:glycoside hydrolase family 2 TIM barrel-domain containing protein n=1 Tax=Proteiniphilum sp. TaxID=1926877 RepID=UPI002ABA9C4F|nr:glycoside hydrolase family 2 TIM barrel-domain containing protein [Proteiniphilum sp.]MDY9919415.1 glycoside hydrolase family 2 TIM barrel-domain containing protein [Proteiniphilum sp.]